MRREMSTLVFPLSVSQAGTTGVLSLIKTLARTPVPSLKFLATSKMVKVIIFTRMEGRSSALQVQEPP
jgi:hypothetical protein